MWENINCGDFINCGRLSSLLWVVLNAICGKHSLLSHDLDSWSRVRQEEDEEHSRDLDNSDRFSRRVFLPNLEKGFN